MKEHAMSGNTKTVVRFDHFINPAFQQTARAGA